MWSWIHGNGGALLLNGSAVVARHCTLAVAPAIVDAMNQTEHVESTSERCAALHEIIVELYGILDLRLDTAEAEGRSVRDDRGRARQLLELAGMKTLEDVAKAEVPAVAEWVEDESHWTDPEHGKMQAIEGGCENCVYGLSNKFAGSMCPHLLSGPECAKKYRSDARGIAWRKVSA